MLNNLKEWFLELSQAARIAFITSACAILILFLGLSYWALSTDYQILFADLDPQDGSAIVNELERMKIPYRFEDGGKTILIEKDQVYKTRLKLMGKGVNLKGTVGFEIFNESDFGMTDFAQRINYQRALQGEIARTIMGLEEVQSARVHLVIPESSFLKKGEKQAKASITITPKAGYKLSTEQVLGIQRLVAAAVPEIDPTNVTILDSRGVALTKTMDKEQEETRSIENRLALKQQTEEYFSHKVAAILDKTFGPGKAIVSVDVTLNHDLLKVTREDILPAPTANGDPNGAVTRQKRHSTHSGKAKSTATNPSTGQIGSDNESGTSSDQTINEVEYQHGKKIEQLISNPGSIKRLSVGVILPSNVDPDRIDMLSRVISMTVGLNSERGDALAVYPLDRFMPHELSSQGTTTHSFQQEHSPSNISDNTFKIGSNSATKIDPTLLTSLIGAIVIVVLLLWFVIRHNLSRTHKMTEADREKMLKEIEVWLAQPQDPTQRNTLL